VLCASGPASGLSAPPFAPQPGPWRGRAPRQRPADRAVTTHRDCRRAAANAAAVATAPSLARLPAKMRCSSAVLPSVTCSSGPTSREGTLRTVSVTCCSAACRRGSQTREGTRRWLGRRSRGCEAVQAGAACTICPKPPPLCAWATGSAHNGQTRRWEHGSSMRERQNGRKKSGVRGSVGQGRGSGRRAGGGRSAQFLVRLDLQNVRRERLADRLSGRLLDAHHIAAVEVLQARFEHCGRL
jgi:hypothetical protein